MGGTAVTLRCLSKNAGPQQTHTLVFGALGSSRVVPYCTFLASASFFARASSSSFFKSACFCA